MNIGIMDSALRVEWIDLFDVAAAIGFDGVELGVGPDAEKTELWSPEGRLAIQERAQRTGVEVASVCLHFFWKFSFAADDEETVAKARELTEQACSYAEEVGARVILVPVTPGPEGLDPEEGRRRWIEQVTQVAVAAEECGVTLALENVGRGYGRSANELLEIVSAVDSAYVGVYYDIGNATAFGFNPAEEIAALRDLIAQVHTKEREAELLGEGVVKHAEALEALRKVDFDGYIVCETAPTDDPQAAARHNLEFLRKLVD